MTTKSKKAPPPDALLEQALEFIAEAPEDDFLEYLKDSEEDPETLSKMTGDAVAAAVKTVGKKKLAAAREEQKRKLADIEALRRERISAFGGDARAAFSQLVADATNAGHKVSLQHRLLEGTSEEEVKAMMLELLVLLQSKEGGGNP